MVKRSPAEPGVSGSGAKRSHHIKPLSGEEQRIKARCASIQDFFKSPPPAPKAGRPAGLPPKKRGRPAGPPKPPVPEEPLTLPPVEAAPALGKRAAAAMLGTTLKRVNWGKGDALARLTKAVDDWDNKTGTVLEADKSMNLPKYAECVGIPYPTLAPYARDDVSKRKQLGISVGNQAHFSEYETGFTVDAIRRYDRGNDGKNKREIVDMLHDLKPELSRRAVQRSFDETTRPQHKEQLTGIVKANSTTVKRTAITVAQQWRWHTVGCMYSPSPPPLLHNHSHYHHHYLHHHRLPPLTRACLRGRPSIKRSTFCESRTPA